jgi:hypothetical protein
MMVIQFNQVFALNQIPAVILNPTVLNGLKESALNAQQGLIIILRETVFVLVMYAKHLITSMESVQVAIKDSVLQMGLALRVLTQANAPKRMQQQVFVLDALMEAIYPQAQLVLLWILNAKHLIMLLTSVIIATEVMDRMLLEFVNKIV